MRTVVMALHGSHLLKAWYSWVAWSRQNAEHVSRLSGAIVSLSADGRAMRQALNTWVWRSQQRSRSLQLMTRACHGLRSALLWGFEGWVSALEPSEGLLGRALGHMLNRQLSTAYNSWLELSEARARAYSALSFAARAIAHRRLRLATNAWIDFAIASAEMTPGARAAAHLLHQGLSRGLGSWMEYTRLLQLVRRAASAMRDQGLSRGMNSWVVYAEERGAALATLETSVCAMRAGALRHALNTWIEKTFDAPVDPRVRAVAHLVHRELSRALASWSEATEAWLVMMSAMAALRNRDIKRAMLTWMAYADEHAESLRVLRSGLSAARDGRRRAWNQWAGQLAGYAALRVALHRLQSHQQVKTLNSWVDYAAERRRYRRALAQFTHYDEAVAWRTWRAAMARIKAKLDALAAKARALMAGPTLKALNKWKAVCAKGRLLRRAGAAIAFAKGRAAWNTWQELRVSTAQAKQRVGAALRQLSPEGRAMAKALRSWIALSGSFAAIRRALVALTRQHVGRAYRRWVEMAHVRAGARVRLAGVLYALSPDGKAKRRAFNQLSAQLDAWRLLRRACARMVLIRAVRCLLKWQHAVEQVATLRRVAASARNSTLSRAFRTWMETPPHPAKVVLTRWINNRLCAAYMTWSTWVLALSQARQAVAHLLHQGLSRGMNSWVVYAEERGAALATLETSVCAMRAGALRHALNTWIEKTFDAPVDPRVRAVAHLVHRELSRALASWSEATEAWLVMMSAMAALRNRDIKRAMLTWMAYADEHAESLRVLRSGLSAARDGRRRAWNQWAGQLAGYAALRVALHRLQSHQQVKTLNSWVDYAAERRRYRRALAHLSNHEVARGFMSWVDLVHARRACLVGPRRAIAHWRAIKVVRALNRWEALVVARRLLRRAAASLFHSRARVALNTWGAYVDASSAARTKLAATLRRFSPEGRAVTRAVNAWRGRVLERQQMRRAVAALAHSSSYRAWRKWAAVTALAAVLRAVFFRMRNRALVRAWGVWVRSPMVPTPAKRAASRIVNQPLARAFTHWGAVVDSIFAMARAASYLANRELARSWRSWEALCIERELMAVALSNLLGAALRRGLNTWLAWFDETVETQDTITRCLRAFTSRTRAAFNTWAAHQTPDHVSRAVGHLANRTLSMGWNTWTAQVRERERMRCALAHLIGRDLVRAFNSWEAYLEMLRMLRRAAASLYHHASRKALTTWREYREARALQLRKLRKTLAAFRGGPRRRALNTWADHVAAVHMKRRALARLVHSGTGRAFTSWLAHLEARAAQLQRIRSALLAFSSKLRVSYNTWADYALERRLALVAVRSLLHQSRRRAFNAWSDLTERRLAAHECLAASLAALGDNGRRKAFNSWIDMLERLAPLHSAIAHMVHASAARALNTWLDYLDSLAAKRRALSHMLHQDLVRGLHTWIARIEERETMRITLARMLQRHVRRALLRWAQSAEEREEKLRRMRGTLYSLAGGHRTLKALNSWKEAITLRAQARRALSAFVNQSSRRAWNRWAGAVVRASEIRAQLRACLMVAERKAFNGWHANFEHERYVAASLAHFVHHSEARAWRQWRHACDTLRTLLRGLAGFHSSLVRKAYNTWLEACEERARRLYALRGALNSLRNGESRRAFNSWLRHRAQRQKSLQPLLRGLAHWRNAPVSKALNRLVAAAAGRRRIRTILFRWRNRKLASAVRAWRSRVLGRREVPLTLRLGLALRHPRQRRALNSWLFHIRGKQRLRALVLSFKGHRRGARRATQRRAGAPGDASALLAPQPPPYTQPASQPSTPPPTPTPTHAAGRHGAHSPFPSRCLTSPLAADACSVAYAWAGFNKWKEEVVRRREASQEGVHLRTIRALTWRQACAWLHSLGIAVSRSPPTLLRQLRMGVPYAELVRRISVTWCLRHNIAHIAEPLALFRSLQQLYETELVVCVVGCQRFDARALEEGKALEHLELLASLREVIEAVQEARAARDGIMY